MEVIYLEAEDIESLHDKALERHGGLPGRPPNKLEGVLSMPMSGFGDYERYPDIMEKAAVYHYYLASGHCFNDGNKRTSFLAMFTFLRINGYELTADPQEAFLWTLELAQDNGVRPTFEEAVSWVRRNSFDPNELIKFLKSGTFKKNDNIAFD